jgi:hypothetical protein
MDMKTTRLPALLLIALMLSGCASLGAQRTPRDDMLYSYVSAVRWSDFDAALNFVDPEVRLANPISDLERERYKQYQVAGYDVKSGSEPGEGLYEQVVEIRLVNRHTQTERVITDRQSWRYDPESKRWWLMSGLPDLSPR